jgi:hypothetical protein
MEGAADMAAVVISVVDGTEVTVVDGTEEVATTEDMVTSHLPMVTSHLPMVTPLRPMRMGILTTDRGTIPATGTMVITVEGAITDTDGRSGQTCSLTYIE